MTDKKNLKMGLEEVSDFFFEMYRKETDEYKAAKAKEYCDIAEDVIALLKEQEAKSVIADKRRIIWDDSYDEATYSEDTFYRCPSCNRVLSRTHMKKSIHFCEECGQAVKWE